MWSLRMQIAAFPLYTASLHQAMRSRDVARIFQRGGGGGHTVSNNMVMAFSPRNIVDCFLKKKAY